ncbi:MAG: hypothetical protein EOO38_05130 [Cytophagaceae bacterium]|nr:MAG: hypothetical protein EOO38_05130 [Cytophagaceae bacterium]
MKLFFNVSDPLIEKDAARLFNTSVTHEIDAGRGFNYSVSYAQDALAHLKHSVSHKKDAARLFIGAALDVHDGRRVCCTLVMLFL